MSQLTTVAEVFDALGGAPELVALTQAKRTAVAMWRVNGRFPAKTYLAITGELKRRRMRAPPSLWGMVAPPRAKPKR